MAIPTKLPEWNETEVNSIEPDVQHKAEGWLAPAGVPEKPPFQTFNWWQNLVYKWIKYFKEFGLSRVDDYTALSAITSPSDGDTVNVTDIGIAGIFTYDSAQSAINNGGTIIDGWVRQYSGAINVKWFGFTGTGDQTIYFEAAIAQADDGSTITTDGKYTFSCGSLNISEKIFRLLAKKKKPFTTHSSKNLYRYPQNHYSMMK